MVNWGSVLVRSLLAFENRLVFKILSFPGFHRAVGRVHRTVEDMRFGRNPSEPLRQGEATELPTKEGSFLSYFVQEIRNQLRGQPTNVPPPKP